MVTLKNSRVSGTIPLLITICLLSIPAYAKYSGGTGDPNDPYLIATAEDLMLLGDSPEDYDKHFILTADIDLDLKLPGRKVFDKAVISPDTAADTWGWEGTAFTRVFDGNGHTISHLTITGGSYLGLFGRLESGAEVRDLGVVDVNITGSGRYVGGLVGSNRGFVTQCYSTGAVNGERNVGGLVGVNEGYVTRCYSNAVVSGDLYVGGLVGYNSNGSVLNCYSTGALCGSGYVGGLVGRGNATQCFWDTWTSGQATSAGGTGLTTAEMQLASTFLDAVWDFVDETER